MRITFLLGILVSIQVIAAADRIIPVPNGDFEQGLKGWTIPGNEGMTTLASDPTASGKHSLKIVDRDGKKGSDATATWIPIPGQGFYQLRGKIYAVTGDGLGMYSRVLKADGKALGDGGRQMVGLGGKDKKWRDFAYQFYVSEGAAFIQLWIHSYGSARVEAYLDDIHYVQRDVSAMKPPWKGTYKIKPHEKNRLTAADVVGPDGIVYPDWRYAGVQGGIPRVAQKATIEQFGGKADDQSDDAAALQKACESVGKQGGGAVVLGAGTYYLDRPILVRQSGVVIRGQGREKTRVIFRFDIPKPGAAFYGITNNRVGNNTNIQLHCLPTNLMTMRIECDGKTMATWERSKHSGNTYSMWMHGRDICKMGKGKRTLVGAGTYRDGKTISCKLVVDADPGYTEPNPALWAIQGAITFMGEGYKGPKNLLARDGKRGDTELLLAKDSDLKPGEYVLVDGPPTKRWKDVTQNLCQWGTYRRCIYQVKSVNGKAITINQPLRLDFPTIDRSCVRRFNMVERCGVEDFYIEQTANLWITTVMFRSAANCWGRGVKIKKCGRNPIYAQDGKWCEIRDCVFEDAWFKGGGGTAYTGWERAWDCLMEDVETFRFRHAPLFQWAASGNVIRKSVFHDSDGQWHSGWTNENLMEQCIITSRRGNGGYGFGLWASPPEDRAHGPNGPRNVVYNCDITSERAGLWMGGMNENWLILHNRFHAEKGEGIFGKTSSFDHIIKDNVFILDDKNSPMIVLTTPDCMGAEIINNKLYGGNGNILGGYAKPAVRQGNQTFPLSNAPRPNPAVPSIYEWQKNLPK